MDRSKQNSKDTKGLADTFQKLYSELPRELEVMSNPELNQLNVNSKTTHYSNESVSNDNLEVVGFLKKYLPRSDHKEIDGELKKTFALHKQKGGKIKKPQPKRKGKYLTSRERRALNLNRLPRSGGLKYSQYSEVNEMWEDYMRDLLGWKDQQSAASQEMPQSRTQPNSKKLINVGDEQFRMRICRADYHGALVKITKSNVQSQLGLQGFIVMETRNTLQLLTEIDEIKIIPKSGTSFSFCLDNHLFTVGGSNFCLKPSERAVKKWKNRPPYDL